MIRIATRSDIPQVVELIVEFLQADTAYRQHIQQVNREHLYKLAYQVIHTGYIWLLFNGPVAVGLLAAVKEANMWIPHQVSLREIVWYVREEYRKTIGAGRLFINFCQTGDALIAAGQIFGYFTTRMTSTEDYDLLRRGFRVTETLYIRDQGEQ